MTAKVFYMFLLISVVACAAGTFTWQSSAQSLSLNATDATSPVSGAMAGQGAAAGCRPGDLEIGRQETADEIIVYCSRVSCEQISQRVEQDIAAQKTLETSMEQNNAELKEWAQENETARSAALNHAIDQLSKYLLSFSADRVDQKIATLQDELNRGAASGEFTGAGAEGLRTLRSAGDRWREISDAFVSVRSSTANTADTWVALQLWEAKAEKQRAALTAGWTAVSGNPEIGPQLRNGHVDVSVNALNAGLKPFLSGSFDLDKFLGNYGYDASVWRARQLLILRRVDQPDRSVMANCKLGRLFRIDVRNMNVCNGRLPDPDAPDPEEERCNPAP